MSIVPAVVVLRRVEAELAAARAEIDRLRTMRAEVVARFIRPNSDWGHGYNAGIVAAICAMDHVDPPGPAGPPEPPAGDPGPRG